MRGRRPLPLRTRLALISALAVAVGVAAASATAYVATERALRAQVDRGLLAAQLTGPGPPAGAPLPVGTSLERLCSAGIPFGAGVRSLVGSVQLVRADGSTCGPPGASLVRLTAADVAVAAGGPATALRDDVTADGTPVRVLTQPADDGYAVLLARDLGEVTRTLRSLALGLLVACGTGVVLAGTAGLLVARAGLRPVDDLTAAVEQIAATQDLDAPIRTAGHDEVARLATAFNRMTGALAAARFRQQQLVADASHELRTPLTSLRTNIELLQRSESAGRPLGDVDRRELLESIDAQISELTQLVAELTDLAHDSEPPAPVQVRLDDVVRRAVARAERRGEQQISVDAEPWQLRGDPVALERAVLNVLDNAVKFSPPDSRIDVALHAGTLTVADRGVGLSAEDVPHVFDRFWRSASARAQPGSGLGLAIVADVVARHGGSVSAESRPGGGAVFSLQLPGRA